MFAFPGHWRTAVVAAGSLGRGGRGEGGEVEVRNDHLISRQ